MVVYRSKVKMRICSITSCTELITHTALRLDKKYQQIHIQLSTYALELALTITCVQEAALKSLWLERMDTEHSSASICHPVICSISSGTIQLPSVVVVVGFFLEGLVVVIATVES